ncbi:MAG: FAD-dependent oxidoreductase [Actinomycetota bacterium]
MMDLPIDRHDTDVLIVGGGAAGTMAAFEAADAGVEVIQVTKARATNGAVTVARGGFAAALGDGDSPEKHLADILEHGGELIDPELTRVWVHDIVDVVRDLEEWGAGFVRNEDGELDLKMFPNHSHPRAVHYHDQTGNRITKVLSRRLRSDSRIGQHSQTAVMDLLSVDGRVVGAWGVDYSRGRLVVYAAREVILCTGGGSGLYYVNDNPPQVTGDGYVLGFRAGAPLVGLEMIDFQAMCCSPEELFGFAPHPTGFINAGAVFRNQEGEPFLRRYFPETAEKSTRSEVILAMAKEIHSGRAGKTGGIFMDATGVPLDVIMEQIPHVHKICLSRGVDITQTPLEVAPGSHTWLGGLKIDTRGHTPVPGLWAAGETAGGIHGGNRIGGSAISSALVFGRRAGRAASTEAKEGSPPVQAADLAIPPEESAWIADLLGRSDGVPQSEVRLHCRMVAHDQLGPLRDGPGLADALSEFERIEEDDLPRMRLGSEAAASPRARGQELESALSVRNLALLGRLVATVALDREESRGAHFRLDFPHTDEAGWRAVTLLTRGPDGRLLVSREPVADSMSPPREEQP